MNLRKRWLGTLVAFVLAMTPALGQQEDGDPADETGIPSPTNGEFTRGGNVPSSESPSPQPQRAYFVTGNVVLEDGLTLPGRVLIERICSVNSVRAEGYTDSKGHFSLQIGQESGLVADASTSPAFGPSSGAGSLAAGSNQALTASGDPAAELDQGDCELRGNLAGYRSDTISLVGKRYRDNPSVGTIVLHPLAKTKGLTISVTSAKAPKDARKALEKGIDEFRKQRFDKAEKDLGRAVEMHPGFAEAWLELGRTLRKLSRPDDAKAAFQKAIAADSRFVPPYVGLYEIAFEQENLQELADLTDTVIRMNPYEFPMAFYYNGVANYQLKNFKAAERSAREAVEADNRHVNPKSHYLLGLILLQTRDLTGAQQSFRRFLEVAPNDSQRPSVENVLAQIDKALSAPAGD